MALLEDVIQYGTLAARPAATAVAVGTLYFCSDAGGFRSNGTTWDAVGASTSFQAQITWQADGRGTTMNGIGSANGTNSGTIAAANDTDNPYVRYTTGAVSGNTASFTAGSFAFVQTRWGLDIQFLVRAPADLTSIRLWIGLFANNPSDADNMGQQGLAFRFSSVAGDTGWTPQTRDGAGPTTGTGIGTVVADTPYRLRIRVPSGGAAAYFSVNGSAEQSIATTLPTTTQDLGPSLRVITQTAATRNTRLARVQLKFGQET